MTESPRVLVGTLYCGENEFDALKASLQEQTYPHWDHVVYKNLPNKEAHDRLYRTFMEQQDDFDLFLKLDADMVFRSDEGLRQIVRIFGENPDLDHLTLAVRDWYSDSLIEGLHTFSSNVSWSAIDDDRFVDPSPEVPRRHFKLWDDPAPVVDHSPDPFPFQAFRFGVHRALKVIQPERWRMRYMQTRGQWSLLERCWEHFQSMRDRRLGLAILGADLTIQGQLEPRHYDESGESLRKIFQQYEDISAEDLYSQLSTGWRSKRQRRRRYWQSVGRIRLAASAAYHLAYRAKEQIVNDEHSFGLLGRRGNDGRA